MGTEQLEGLANRPKSRSPFPVQHQSNADSDTFRSIQHLARPSLGHPESESFARADSSFQSVPQATHRQEYKQLECFGRSPRELGSEERERAASALGNPP